MEVINYILFLLTVLAANIIQGITGFAGTVLAMPVSVMLVGFETAKPILNLLGVLSGIYVLITSHRFVNRKEFLKCSGVMLIGIAGGVFFKSALSGNEKALYIILGIIVMAVGFVGVVKSFRKKTEEKKQGKIISAVLLLSAGTVHGLFVCGGPLLVSYMTGRTQDKNEFRATLSSIWVVLNGILFFDDLRSGLWTLQTAKILLPSVALLFAGMFIGSILYKKMSREFFMKLTYVLLVISGASLLFK